MLRTRHLSLLVGCLAVLLAACTRPAVTGFSQPVPEATVQRVFVATQRTASQIGQIFGENRNPVMNYAAVDVSIPPDHELGHLERTSGLADPRRYFAPVGIEAMNGAPALTSALRRARAGDGGLLLFVHGYNNTLEDAAFRLAQIRHDFALEEPALLFSWPSAGDPRGYVYDRDSVMFARDGFVQLLRDLNRSGQKRILLVAHSMGSYLAMESLRQIALTGDRHLYGALEGVILMSPDIDPDVFRQQAAAIGKLPQPFIIMTSQSDRVLSLSGLLTGRKARLGRIKGPEEVEGLNVTVIDISGFDDAALGGHNVPFSSAKAIVLLRGLDRQLRTGRTVLDEFVFLGRDLTTGLRVP
ncbi:alpha/beta hydrolase [Marimonas arenosa]|uniref:Alpha/beta fold hydrolase n=1 Tax=Marimonas arenosa TaxID=1795305 RepID=A0AAE4B693_9RHOB|nr:alpha/beta fold hydrolase [Marimonas arenosa]MDQ2091084.1 alpha/beta fold hydrolase [Marimonas arenosa]